MLASNPRFLHFFPNSFFVQFWLHVIKLSCFYLMFNQFLWSSPMLMYWEGAQGDLGLGGSWVWITIYSDPIHCVFFFSGGLIWCYGEEGKIRCRDLYSICSWHCQVCNFPISKFYGNFVALKIETCEALVCQNFFVWGFLDSYSLKATRIQIKVYLTIRILVWSYMQVKLGVNQSLSCQKCHMSSRGTLEPLKRWPGNGE